MDDCPLLIALPIFERTKWQLFGQVGLAMYCNDRTTMTRRWISQVTSVHWKLELNSISWLDQWRCADERSERISWGFVTLDRFKFCNWISQALQRKIRTGLMGLNEPLTKALGPYSSRWTRLFQPHRAQVAMLKKRDELMHDRFRVICRPPVMLMVGV